MVRTGGEGMTLLWLWLWLCVINAGGDFADPVDVAVDADAGAAVFGPLLRSVAGAAADAAAELVSLPDPESLPDPDSLPDPISLESLASFDSLASLSSLEGVPSVPFLFFFFFDALDQSFSSVSCRDPLCCLASLSSNEPCG